MCSVALLMCGLMPGLILCTGSDSTMSILVRQEVLFSVLKM